MNGAVESSQKPVWLSVAVRNPVEYFTGSFARFLKSSGLELTGIRDGRQWPGGPRPFHGRNFSPTTLRPSLRFFESF